ncbi:MAG: SufE family protein [Bacteroidetes bacterium]|nr:MAG: SufE family protein [Bacteroidota bacterium]
MESIDKIQDQIIDEFSVLSGDLEMAALFIMELGQKLPKMKESEVIDRNLVKGCQSKVWLTAMINNEKIFFNADSNAEITKGLVSLLIRIFSGQKADDIINADLYFIEKIGMNRFIGTQRSNGFASMIKQMKLFGMVLKTQLTISS